MSPRHDSERGTAMLEFALSAVVVFTLIFGCMVLALALYSYEVVNQYARDASRYAIVHGNGCSSPLTNPATSCSIGTGAPANTALKSFLNVEAYPGISGSSLSVSTAYAKSLGEGSCYAAGCNGSGDQVTVTVSYPYLYSVPFVRSRSFTMTAVSVMTISQ